MLWGGPRIHSWNVWQLSIIEKMGSFFIPLFHLPDDLVLEFASAVSLSPLGSPISSQFFSMSSIFLLQLLFQVLLLFLSTSVKIYRCLKFPLPHFPFFSHQAFKFTMRSFIKAIDDQILLKLKAVVYSTCDSPLNTIWHNCSLSFESLHLLGFSIP